MVSGNVIKVEVHNQLLGGVDTAVVAAQLVPQDFGDVANLKAVT